MSPAPCLLKCTLLPDTRRNSSQPIKEEVKHKRILSSLTMLRHGEREATVSVRLDWMRKKSASMCNGGRSRKSKPRQCKESCLLLFHPIQHHLQRQTDVADLTVLVGVFGFRKDTHSDGLCVVSPSTSAAGRHRVRRPPAGHPASPVRNAGDPCSCPSSIPRHRWVRSSS